MGAETALLGLFGLSSAFALVSLLLSIWMTWRIVAKAGFPGWLGLLFVLLPFTGVGSLVSLVLLWIFAFIGWPRDEDPLLVAARRQPGAAPAAPQVRGPGGQALPAPAPALPDKRGWTLTGKLAGGVPLTLTVDGSSSSWLLTGAPAARPGDLTVADPSVGQPHARILVSGSRLGLEDLGTRGGTFIDGARLLPEHGPRDISAVRMVRLGTVELSLARA
ncbi:MAG TPA: FHA domain-containing protein [Reyranella sp.]|nr:FHA domain-containing protein [Reyranella sp.]